MFTFYLIYFCNEQEHLENDDCFRRMQKFNGLLLLFAEVCKMLFCLT
jgi:hypothetical protein